MARSVKMRKAKVGLHQDNSPPLGTRKPLGVMVEPGQDAEASDYPASPSRKNAKRQGEKSKGGGSGSAAITTTGKGKP